MPYGYIGQNLPNQTRSNSGVFSISDVADLEKQGKFGGSLELIEEQTFSGVANLDFLTIQENVYDVHLLQIEKIFHSVATNTGIRLYESGVLESASVYENAAQSCQSSGTFSEVRSTTNTRLNFGVTNNGAVTNDNESGYGYFYNLGNSSKYSFYTFMSVVQDNGVQKNHFGGGVLPQASTVNGIRLNMSSSGSSGVARLYGVKQI